MDLSLALGLAHSAAALAWTAGGLVLALILLAARRDPEAARRALPEARLIGRRVLGPLGLATILTGAPLAALLGLGAEAWVLLGAALVLAGLAARRLWIEPALALAEAGRAPVGRALRLAALEPAAVAAAVALMALRPGWGEAAILAGLLACLALALALARSLDDGAARPA